MNGNRKSVWIQTLGCPKNEVDSEVMAGILRCAGVEIVSHWEDADLLVVNTCAFIDEAKEESIEAVLEAGTVKGDRKLLVTGCLAERYAKELKSEMPEIDAIVGVQSLQDVGRVARRTLGGGPACDDDATAPESGDGALEQRVSLGSTHTAYLKIAEGCDRPCAFCSIPSFRGKLQSRSTESLVREARRLAQLGARELVLIGQETTAYGNDLGGGGSIAHLLGELQQVKEIDWIRLMYAYPTAIDEALVARLASGGNICRYIDMPIQHINSKILKRMRRGGSGRVVREAIERLRKGVPGVTIRSSVMVGFPGETEADFEELRQFVAEGSIDHLGVFRFSPQEGTAAFEFSEQVPDMVSAERHRELIEAQEKVIVTRAFGRVGETVRILIDEIAEGETIGRTESDAPEIDGMVAVPGVHGRPGEFMDVLINEGFGPVLIGEPAENCNG